MSLKGTKFVKLVCSRFMSFRKPSSSIPVKRAKKSVPRKNILDPQGPFLQTWNKILVISCVIAVSVDPLFLYTEVVDGKYKCLDQDKSLQIAFCVLRSFTDLFHVLHILFQFRTGFIAPSSRVFGRGELIDDHWAIAKKYLCSYFIIDILAFLPLPQIVVFIVIPMLQEHYPVLLAVKDLLKFVVIIQYVPRLWRIYPLYKEVTRTSGFLTETAWAAAAFNLCLFMLASHVVGAIWYLLSVERAYKCWSNHCGNDANCTRYLYCAENHIRNETVVKNLNDYCPFTNPGEIKNSSVFNFGIFIDALESGVVESRDFPMKWLYCFWWGLRSLSSLGQNLKTSTYGWEILFAVFIAIFGLVLFSLLIGNMQVLLQKYRQSTSVRVEEMRVKRQDAEQWMSNRMLPHNLKERIRRYQEYKWQKTRGVEEDALVRSLPKDLRKDIKRHLCLSEIIMRVPVFEKMDDRLTDALSDYLKPVLFTEKSYIIREGDPVDEMLFITSGVLSTMTTNGGRTGFFNSADLKAGDFCGEELLTWALDPKSSSNLPSSTRTVVAKTEVEAFALMADDLKLVASQYRGLHSREVQNTFRYHSMQWRTWGACFIQAAWRRYCKWKLEKSLYEAEERRA